MGTRATRRTPSGCGRGLGVAVGVRLGSSVALGRGVSVGVGVDVGAGVGVEVSEGAMVGAAVDAPIGSSPGSAPLLSIVAGSAAKATPTKTIAARTSTAPRSGETAPLLEAPVDDTGEGYPRDVGVSRRAWRIAAALLGVTIGATGLIAMAIAAQPDIRRAAPVWSDEFERAALGWTIDPREGETAGGRLRLHPARPGASALALHALPAGDFVVEAQASVAAGSLDNGYGFVVGSVGEMTAFLVGGDGYFSVQRGIDGRWHETQPWRQWPHVRRGGAVNTLRLECHAAACSFYVNDELTASHAVAHERQLIGVMAQRYWGERLEVEFEYLKVWQR